MKTVVFYILFHTFNTLHVIYVYKSLRIYIKWVYGIDG